MSKRTITALTCDRCGASEEIRRADQEYPWSRVQAEQCNGPFRIGAAGKFADLCPGCADSLDLWWKAGALI